MGGLHVATYALLCGVLLAAAVIDWKRGVVPNRLTMPAMVAGIILAAITGAMTSGASGFMHGLAQSLTALFVGAVPMAVIFFAGGIGGGDVKLVAAAGAICAGWQCMISLLFYAFVVAAVMAVVLMLRHGIVKQTMARLFGALLIASARVKPAIPDDGPKVPFAVGMCVGGMVAGAEYLLNLRLPWN